VAATLRLPDPVGIRRHRIAGRIASALSLDFVIDDRPENCLDVVLESKAKAILIWREQEAELPGKARRLGIGVVSSIAEQVSTSSRGWMRSTRSPACSADQTPARHRARVRRH
jgi:hypothetical protein